MMIRSTLVRMLFAGVVVFGIALGAWLLHARSTPSPASEIPVLDDLAQQNRTRLDALRAELQKAQRAVVRAGAAPQDRYSAALIADVQSEIKVLATARTMFNRDELIRSELDRLAHDAKHVALAVDLATDWRLATQLFGDDQAESRVYALQLLRHLAETGNPDAVATAVDRIGQTLNAEDKWTKGIEYDYVDSLSVYLRSVGLDRFLADQAAYYDRMHLTERTSVEVQKAVHDSGILKDASPTIVAQVRSEFWRYLGKEPPHG